MKHVFVLFAIILVLVPVVKSEEQSWYEIDGIKIRLGQLTFGTNLEWGEDRIIQTSTFYSHCFSFSVLVHHALL